MIARPIAIRGQKIEIIDAAIVYHQRQWHRVGFENKLGLTVGYWSLESGLGRRGGQSWEPVTLTCPPINVAPLELDPVYFWG